MLTFLSRQCEDLVAETNTILSARFVLKHAHGQIRLLNSEYIVSGTTVDFYLAFSTSKQNSTRRI